MRPIAARLPTTGSEDNIVPGVAAELRLRIYELVDTNVEKSTSYAYVHISNFIGNMQ